MRSGALAGAAAAAGDVAAYERDLDRTLEPEMRAGRHLLAAYARHPGAFHAALATPPGWRQFTRFCRGENTVGALAERLPVRMAVAALVRV